MRRSPSPLRAISSPSAELGVDVRRPGLRSAFLPHIIQEPGLSDLAFGYFPGSTDAQSGARSSQPDGDLARFSAAPHPFSEEEKSI
jgi:hypothetical protein